jgi:hypothetical protein
MNRVNKLLKRNAWITSGIRTSCHRKREMYMGHKTNNNPLLKKNYKDYCRILTIVIKQANKMDFDKHITNSSNLMKTSWNLINKELGTGQKKHGIQSLNINGTSTINQQAIASAFNNHFTTLPSMITRKITASSCLARNSANFKPH